MENERQPDPGLIWDAEMDDLIKDMGLRTG
jgi:hypothetical protein